ncbi:putative PilT protein domain protein [Candidatus Sulfopaludibacter sp. SbA4]|nr:putative PilT protein domain protein [Candidatus Sulfopaludibacter sp. SbA4]
MGVSRIFWDTNLFIYLLEGSGEPLELAQKLLNRMFERRDELLTSTLTLGEVLVKPVEMGQSSERYERFLNSPGVHIVSFDHQAARIYARLRRDRTIKPPDAIQLSCAAAAGTNLFITNDARLSRMTLAGIDFIVPLPQVFL